MASNFNSDFYLAVATVIPVILIAINVIAFKRSTIAILIRKLLKPGRFEDARTIIAFILCLLPFLLGLNGELDCLRALHARQNFSGGHDGFLIFTVSLLLAIALSGITIDVLNEMIENKEHKDK